MIASQNTLSRKQADTMLLLGALLPNTRATVRPGYEYDRYEAAAERIHISAPSSGSLVEPAKALQTRGLVRITGVAYGAKTYGLTDDGLNLARALLAGLPECSCAHGTYVDKANETWDEMGARLATRDACARHGQRRRRFGKESDALPDESDSTLA